MKKNILIIQSLLVLPLITPSLILSMETSESATKKEFLSFDNELAQHLSKTGRKADLDANHSIEAMGQRIENGSITTTPTNFTITITETVTVPKTNVTQKIIAESKTFTQEIIELSAIDLLLPTRMTAEEKAESAQSLLIAHQKKELFKRIHAQLLSTIDPQERLKHVEPKNPMLTESVMVTPIPTKKGIASSLYFYSRSAKGHDAITYALENGLFEMDNEDHVRVLETLLESLVEQKNVDQIISILEICQSTAGQLQINDKVARKIHNFLENVTAQEEVDAKSIYNTNTAAFCEASNTLILSLQEELDKRTRELNEKYNVYQTNITNDFTKKADSIRKFKTATTTIHALAPQLKLAKNESCSDTIHFCSSTNDHSKSPKSRICMTQEDVPAIYSNDRLLNKMQLDKPMAVTAAHVINLVEHVDAIHRASKGIKLLTK